MATPYHPWTKVTRDAAAVRIAMTVGQAGRRNGVLQEIIKESNIDTDEPIIVLRSTAGSINSDLTTGVDVTSARSLSANEGMASMGQALGGRGFGVTTIQEARLRYGNEIP